jgi:hypothetical protein
LARRIGQSVSVQPRPGVVSSDLPKKLGKRIDGHGLKEASDVFSVRSPNLALTCICRSTWSAIPLTPRSSWVLDTGRGAYCFLANRTSAWAQRWTRSLETLRLSATGPFASVRWGLSWAGRFGGTPSTIQIEHALQRSSEKGRLEHAVNPDLPSVRDPLSDCALKYISTIWHHPRGRRTR